MMVLTNLRKGSFMALLTILLMILIIPTIMTPTTTLMLLRTIIICNKSPTIYQIMFHSIFRTPTNRLRIWNKNNLLIKLNNLITMSYPLTKLIIKVSPMKILSKKIYNNFILTIYHLMCEISYLKTNQYISTKTRTLVANHQ